MRVTIAVALIAVLATMARAADPPAATSPTYEVVIYGGTSAGLVAAIETVRLGHTAIVIEPREFLGGMSTSGLGWTDSGDKRVIGGLSREFYRRIRQKYDDPAAWKHGSKETYAPYRPGEDALWGFEPHVASEVFAELLAEARVQSLTGLEIKAVSKDGARITGMLLSDGRVVSGRRFIDATYEGDLLALAGVSSTLGREANATYGETLNGVQTARAVSHQFIKPVDPFVRPGDRSSGLLPGIGLEPGVDGAADHCLQAFNYRLCMTNVAENQIPFAQPAGYDPRDHELLLRNFEAGDHRLPLSIDHGAESQDRREQQSRRVDRLDRPELRLSDGQRGRPPGLRAAAQGLHAGAAVDAGDPGSRAGEHPPGGQPLGLGPGRVDRQRPLAAPAIRPRGAADGQRLRAYGTRLPPPAGLPGSRRDGVVQHGLAQLSSGTSPRRGIVRNEGDIQVSPRGPYPIAIGQWSRSVRNARTCWYPSACRAHTSRTGRSGWSRCS